MKHTKTKFLVALSLMLLAVGCAGSNIAGDENNGALSESELQELLSQQFIADQTEIKMLTVEALRAKYENILGLDPNNSAAIDELDANPLQFGGANGEGIRNLNLSSGRMVATFKLADLACGEANLGTLLPNGFSDPSGLWKSFVGIDIQADEAQVLASAAALPDLTTDAQRDFVVCIGIVASIQGNASL